MVTTVEGLVVQASSRDARVRAGGQIWLCSLRGRLRGRRGEVEGQPVVVGDRVIVRPLGESDAVIEEVLPRRNELRRARSIAGRERRSGAREKIVAANMDQVLVMIAARQPQPRWGLVDRVLVSTSYEELDALILVNKWDQVENEPKASEALEKAMEIYRGLGYPVLRGAVRDGRGVEEIEAVLRGRATVLSGHSGVGKSTLIQAICPGAEVATGEISEATGKGRHVTSLARVYEIPSGGILVDTPGYREYGLLDIPPAQLALHYPEMAPHVSRCRYKDCLHLDEPGCAVREAGERGLVSKLRYTSYRQILASLREGAG